MVAARRARPQPDATDRVEMDSTDRAATPDDPIGRPTAPRSGHGPGQGGGGRGRDGNPTGPRDANDPGSTRYGHASGSGRNEPKDHERKEAAGFPSRQGGDQAADEPKETSR